MKTATAVDERTKRIIAHSVGFAGGTFSFSEQMGKTHYWSQGDAVASEAIARLEFRWRAGHMREIELVEPVDLWMCVFPAPIAWLSNGARQFFGFEVDIKPAEFAQILQKLFEDFVRVQTVAKSFELLILRFGSRSETCDVMIHTVRKVYQRFMACKFRGGETVIEHAVRLDGLFGTRSLFCDLSGGLAQEPPTIPPFRARLQERLLESPLVKEI